jgi:DNA-binding beta-propeller fold protein YncE
MTFGKAGLFVGQFARPKGVAIGGDGRIYVVESRHDHLLVFDAKGQLLLPIAGRGTIGSFHLPAGVWTDSQQNVYVADMFNGRVVVFKELTKVSEG